MVKIIHFRYLTNDKQPPSRFFSSHIRDKSGNSSTQQTPCLSNSLNGFRCLSFHRPGPKPECVRPRPHKYNSESPIRVKPLWYTGEDGSYTSNLVNRTRSDLRSKNFRITTLRPFTDRTETVHWRIRPLVCRTGPTGNSILGLYWQKPFLNHSLNTH